MAATGMAAHTGAMQSTPHASHEAHARRGRTHVFVVEDSASIRTRLIDMLNAIEGVSVVGEAESAANAVSGIMQTLPDSVVLDIHLPGGSGIDVLRAVHPRAPGIVFIILTNYPNPQYRRICMQAGASHFLDKTAEFNRVGELIAKLEPAQTSTATHLSH